jgi:prepilin-type N-terminal cleavage/methylation domain-containing protein
LRIFGKERKQKGVTLIELAVVMAIVGIMALFVAPAIGEWLNNFHLRQEARERASDLQFAKMKAISTGVRCTVTFNQDVGGTTYCYVIFPDYDNDLILDTADYAYDLNGDGIMETVNETNNIFERIEYTERNIFFDSAKGTDGNGLDFPLVNGYPAISFDRSGLPKDGAGRLTNAESIYIKNNNKRLQITISPAGRIGINEY